ncbi:hypothetical protein ABPG74_007893 [Tetrahymena malaccensis]
MNPDSIEDYTNLPQLYQQLGQINQAIECNYAILQIDPNHEKTNYNQGIFYFKKGMKEKAISYFEQSYQSNPQFCDSIYNLAIINCLNGNQQQAEYFNRLALQTNSRFSKIYQLLSIQKSQIKMTEEIKNICKSVLNVKVVYGVEYYILAFAQDLLGQKQQALENCENAIKQNELLADAFQLKGQILRQLGQREQSSKCFEEAQKLAKSKNLLNKISKQISLIHPNLSYISCSKKFKGLNLAKGKVKPMQISKQSLNQQNKYLNALIPCFRFSRQNANFDTKLKQKEQILLKILQTNPQSQETYEELGNVQLDMRKFENAKKYFKKALEINPQSETAYLGLGIICSEQNMLKESEQYFQKCLEFNPKSALALLNLAILYDKCGTLEQRISTYQKVIEIDPSIYESYNGLGLAYRDKKMNGLAKQLFQKCIEMNPLYISAYFNLAKIFCKEKNYQDCISCLETCLKLNPPIDQTMMIYDFLVEVCKKIGKMKEAIKYLKYAIAIQPEQYLFYEQIGDIYRKMGNLEESLKYCQTALKIYPKSIKSLVNLGFININLGNYQEAQQQLEYALQLDPDAYNCYHFLGYLHFQLGRYEEAQQNYESYFELNPEDDNLQGLELLGFTYLNQIIFNNKKDLLDKARDLYEKLLKIKPDSLEALQNLSGVYFFMGQLDQAIKQNERALQIDPNFDSFNLGIIYFQKGDSEQAFKYFEQSFQSNPYNSDTIFNLGIIYGLNGNSNQAEYFNKLALQTNEDLAQVYSLLNIPESEIKMNQETKNICERAMNAKIQKGVDYYILAFVQNLLGQKEQALYNCEIAIKFNGLLADAYQLKAQLLKQQGQEETATKYLEKARKLKPNCNQIN